MPIDLKKDLKAIYTAPAGRFIVIDVPPRQALMIDGTGDPATSETYKAAVAALYPVAYAVKFAAKALGSDFVVPPLEGLWHADDPAAFVADRRAEWKWTMMIPLPDFVTSGQVDAARAKAAAKAAREGTSLPIGSVRLDRIAEGRCLQALHIGSYRDEAPTLKHLHEVVMAEMGVTFNGPHHEIYLSDPRKVAPDQLKTLLRQPVRPA